MGDSCILAGLTLAEKLLNQWYTDKLQPTGLTPTGYRTCRVLIREGGMQPSRLAEILDRSRPSMTALVERLERDGFVRRLPVPGNRRSLEVVMTETGISRAEEARDILNRADEELIALGGMSPGLEEDLNRLTRVLTD